MIWRCHQQSKITDEHLDTSTCLSCAITLLKHPRFWSCVWANGSESADFWICPGCGWWRAIRRESDGYSYERGSEWLDRKRCSVSIGTLAGASELGGVAEELGKLVSILPSTVGELSLPMLEELIRRAYREKRYLTRNLRPGHVPRIGVWEASGLYQLGLLVRHDGRKVAVEALEAFVRVLAAKEIQHGALVASSGFSFDRAEPAVVAGGIRVELVDSEGLAELLQALRGAAASDLRALIEETKDASKVISSVTTTSG